MLTTELEKQLLALSPAEKAQVIQLLVQSLSNTWQGIEKTPGVCGGDACIAGTRIPVWSLVIDRRLGMSDAKILEAFPLLLLLIWLMPGLMQQQIQMKLSKQFKKMRQLWKKMRQSEKWQIFIQMKIFLCQL